MKKIYISLLACVALFACDDFLEESPRTFLSPDVAYDTEEGLSYGANGLYDRLSIPFFHNSSFGPIVGSWCASTDIYESNPDEEGYGFRPINNLEITSESSQVKSLYDYYYKIITNAQLVITNSEILEWNDEDLENRVKGEAYFFRAFAHFYLAQFFGDVPIVDQLYDKVRLDWERNPKSEVMELVIKDLKIAEERLPDTPWKGQDGRVTRGTAQHLLAYAYLCNEDWKNAEIYGKKVIESGYHRLMTERFGTKKDNAEGNVFWDLFQNGNHNRSAGNLEGLLVIQNEATELFPEVVDGDPVDEFYALFIRFFYPIYYGSGISDSNDADMLKYGGRGKGYILTSRYWIDSLFVDTDDIRGKYPCVQKKFEMAANGRVISDWDTANENQKQNMRYRPYPTKWNWDGDSRAGSFDTDAMTRDFYFYRLSETYLIVAEALHRQNNNSRENGAAYYINEVRKRAGASEIQASDVSIDFILDERGRELFGEIPRRIDLMRTGKLVERANKYNPGVAGKATSKYNLFPIPQNIIDLNIDREMPQNPEW
ncbi:MAG: RagB/SusD family nutrient uptake outer membrane protein [Candidatus Azobacteroides sp.]|nr:RagB/SusD family nutrient uptake outer membrane protein [Candidatus Azobacteroides sp.]